MLVRIMICIVALTSCSTKVRTPADFDLLPRNKGIYGGSFYLVPWEYCDSDAEWHHFYYNWFNQNWKNTRRVKIKRSLVMMPFERSVGGYYKTICMEPVMRDGRIVAFKTKARPDASH